MSQMDDWQVQLHQHIIPLRQLTVAPLETANQLEHDRPIKTTALELMDQSRQREIKCISNYFPIDSIAAFAHTLTAIGQILHIDCQSMKARLDAAKIKTGTATLESAEALQTTRAKFELCFSRRWRQHQSTIFLILEEFVTPERRKKYKALLVNQRGLILQVLSNIDTSNGFPSIAKVLKISYTRLENLVILAPLPSTANLDSMQVLKSCLPSVNVVMVTFRERSSVQKLRRENISECAGQYMVVGGAIKLAKYCEQQVILWYFQQNQISTLEELLVNLSLILRRQKKVSLYFPDFPYGHHQFNQKQFLLRLFSFYFNFICLERMEGKNDEEIKSRIHEECTVQLLDEQKEVEEKSKEREVHSFTTNRSPLYCPVCKKRSKITCLRCCGQFGTKFALCEVTCFEKFHQNRILYAAQISNRRKINDFLIQDRGKDREHSQEEKKDEDADAPNIAHIQTMAEINEKWRSTIERERTRYEHFLKMSSMNLMPRKIVDRMTILSNQIQHISQKILLQTSTPAKEE